MNYLKILIVKFYLAYEKYFPVQRGKFFLSRLLTSVMGEVSMQSSRGVWLRIIPSSPMDRSYFNPRNDSHEMIINDLDKLKEGDIFVDIGANIGFYSFYAAHKIGRSGLVYSFEPSKREYSRLLFGIKLNELNTVLPFNCALSDYNGVIEFQINKFHTGLNQFGGGIHQDENNCVVPVYRADALICQHRIALVKIDVEGAEMQVLAGLSGLLKKREIARLIVEITPDFLLKYNSSRNELYTFMEKFGYKALVKSNDWQYDEIFVINELI